MTFQRFFTTIVGITFFTGVDRTYHCDALEAVLGDRVILINHVTVLEEVDARSQIALRLLVDEVERLK